MNMANKAVFFDRDGTLNVDVHFLHRPEEFIWTPDAKEAIKYVNEQGYLAILITNQSGVARGYFPETCVTEIYDWMNAELAKIGAHLDALYYCPHHPKGKIDQYRKLCDCRKPSPKMVNDACQRFTIDKAQSYFVGDSDTDMQCANNAHIEGIRYTSGSLLKLLQENI